MKYKAKGKLTVTRRQDDELPLPTPEEFLNFTGVMMGVITGLVMQTLPFATPQEAEAQAQDFCEKHASRIGERQSFDQVYAWAYQQAQKLQARRMDDGKRQDGSAGE